MPRVPGERNPQDVSSVLPQGRAIGDRFKAMAEPARKARSEQFQAVDQMAQRYRDRARRLEAMRSALEDK